MALNHPPAFEPLKQQLPLDLRSFSLPAALE
jgi:hypothetical protein